MIYNKVYCASVHFEPTWTNAFTYISNPTHHISWDVKSNLSIFSCNGRCCYGVNILPGAPSLLSTSSSSPCRGSNCSTWGTFYALCLNGPTTNTTLRADKAPWDRACKAFFCFFWFFFGFFLANERDSISRMEMGHVSIPTDKQHTALSPPFIYQTQWTAMDNWNLDSRRIKVGRPACDGTTTSVLL